MTPKATYPRPNHSLRSQFGRTAWAYYECYCRSLTYDLFDFIFPFSKVNTSQPSTSIRTPFIDVPIIVHSEQP